MRVCSMGRITAGISHIPVIDDGNGNHFPGFVAGELHSVTIDLGCGNVRRYVIDNIQEEELKLSELDYLRGRFWDKAVLDVEQTHSPLMKSIFEKVRSVAATRTTVILYGVTGTGKGVIA